MCIFLKQYTIGSAPSYRAVSCNYLCIFSKRAPNDGYVDRFCKQYLGRVQAASSVFLSRMEGLFGDDVKNSCLALL